MVLSVVGATDEVVVEDVVEMIGVVLLVVVLEEVVRLMRVDVLVVVEEVVGRMIMVVVDLVVVLGEKGGVSFLDGLRGWYVTWLENWW